MSASLRTAIDGRAGAAAFPLNADALDALLAFAELVQAWRKRTDLVAASTVDALADVLFVDAFELAKVAAGRVVDIGAGAGAPGVPLAILNPELHVTLVEPRRRRVAFMRTAVGQLRLAKRVRVIEGRHDVAPGPFDFAYSRATFAPPEWLTIGAVMAPRVGVLLAAGDAPVKAGWQVTQERAYTTVAASRRLLVFKPE